MAGSKPKVTLLSYTELPIETLGAVWQASRDNEPVADPSARDADRSLFQKIIQSRIPVAQMIDFVFLLENVSISFREQMVRHKIGVKVGDRIGVDMIPDQADSVWWSQSMRVMDMGQFAENNAFFVPDTIVNNPDALQTYVEAMEAAETAYVGLTNVHGIPRQDARNVIPLGAGHRIVWKLNLASLMHVVGHRGCWILQLGFWKPIIRGMVEELATQIDPLFRDLISPPCMVGDEFKGCCYELDNEKRLIGEDPLPPCPLWLGHNKRPAYRILSRAAYTPECWTVRTVRDETVFRPQLSEEESLFAEMLREYGDVWRRDPWTGEPLPKGEEVEEEELEEDSEERESDWEDRA